MVNPGKLALTALPPGKYQLGRYVMNHLGEIGTGAILDRQFFELKAGEMKSIQYVREKGARVRGKATWPADTKLMGIVISVRSERAEKGPFDEHEWTTTYASQTAMADGTFLTERIARERTCSSPKATRRELLSSVFALAALARRIGPKSKSTYPPTAN